MNPRMDARLELDYAIFLSSLGFNECEISLVLNTMLCDKSFGEALLAVLESRRLKLEERQKKSV